MRDFWDLIGILIFMGSYWDHGILLGDFSDVLYNGVVQRGLPLAI
jgi:hypothetical protein